MNKLPSAERAEILGMMVEGMSIRAITQLTGVSKNTVAKLIEDAGQACQEHLDASLRSLTCKRIQVGEIWAFCYSKQNNVATAKAAPEGAGDIWTWTAIDADTKLMVSYLVGGRDGGYALALMDDLRSRLVNRVQLTTDGRKAYLQAVEDAFGDDVDYATLIKLYGAAPQAFKGRYSPAQCLGARKEVVTGNRDRTHVSTSYVERSNLTIRMHNRRFTRLTNAFSKKAENHAYAVAINLVYYNFVRIQKTLRVTPAMAAGVTSRLWDISDMVKVLKDWEIAQERA